MYPISTTLTGGLSAGSQTLATKAEILSGGQVIATLTTVTAGKVDVDATAPVRRRGEATIVDYDGTLTPATATDLLTPYGHELRLWRGLVTSAGSELVPLATLRISRANVADSPEGMVLTVTGFDRARTISRNRWTNPYAIAAGTNYVTAIQTLISDRLPGTTFAAVSTTATTPALIFPEQDDPWKNAADMAASIGCEVFFDPLGTCVIRPVPDPTTAATVWTFVEGATCTLLDIQRVHDDETTYNGVVVTGESSSVGTPVRAEVWDSNPVSPTYYLGSYGKVPFFEASQFITTTSQATDAANARLRKVVGLSERLSLDAIPQPALDGSDVITVTRSRSKVNGLYVIDQLSVPLGPGESMPVICRERRSF